MVKTTMQSWVLVNLLQSYYSFLNCYNSYNFITLHHYYPCKYSPKIIVNQATEDGPWKIL